MTNKDTLTQIDRRLKEGATKAEVFAELGGTDDLATLVAASATLEAREKYKTLNLVLVICVYYYVLLKLAVSALVMYQTDSPIYLFPLALIAPAFAIYFAREAKRYRGYAYWVIGGFGVIAVIKSFNADFIGEQTLLTTIWAVAVIPLVFGSYLAFYLKKRMFPEYGYLGAKTDKNGRYVFLSS